MAKQKYVIRQISALGIISASKVENGDRRFFFDATDTSKEYLVEETKQDDCPMFYQAMRLLYGDGFHAGPDCEKLKDVILYIDFSGTFDRRRITGTPDAVAKAEAMLSPEGVTIDFGKGGNKYVAFERSASMSRNNILSFIREDLYEPLRERIMLGMTVGNCQLAKLYAYNGLMYTSGRRYEDAGFLSEKKIVVIDNPKSIVKDAHIITVADDGSDDPEREYKRVEKTADVEVLEFDGEGIISKELAYSLDPTSGAHHSFQIRLPYIKGVVHEIDLRGLFSELGVPKIRDIWGVEHDVGDIEMILTKSMFKGFGWMTENGLTWAQYLERCRKYDHALYISGQDKAERQDTTELNYQFLNTLALTEDEFRPKDLPLGWDVSPASDPRHWLTKTTETAYYNLVANDEARMAYFLRDLDNDELEITDRRRQRAEVIKKNPLFIEESVFAKELSDNAESIRKKYSLGQLLVTGDNRYLSDDLIRLLAYIVKASVGEGEAYQALIAEELRGSEIYAPSPAYPEQPYYTLLRSPHIARNEEAFVKPLAKVGSVRKKYLSHLYYVLMVDSRSLIPERLGGADYDGDMVKTIADPLVNNCVKRGYTGEIQPVLKIPSADPLIADAGDWKARAKTVKSTFSSRVGQISNAALRFGIVAYDENGTDADREESRKSTETLAILTGLEIDSAKSGVKPDLTEYLVLQTAKKSLFLRYKAIAGDNTEPKWYEQTKKQKIESFMITTDWDEVSSNLELLPYYAYMLGEETAKHVPKPAEDEKLFVFAADPGWKDKLDPDTMERTKAIVAAYKAASERIRFVKHTSNKRKRLQDVERILFARGQFSPETVEELYAAFDGADPYAIRRARFALSEQKWHLTPKEDREKAWYSVVPSSVSSEYKEIFCDFRCGGFRLLGDVICDLDELYQSRSVKKNAIKKSDTPELKKLLNGALYASDYKEAIVKNCIVLLTPPDRREKRVDMDEAVRCAAALGERRFILEVLPYAVGEAAVGAGEKKKRRWFGL